VAQLVPIPPPGLDGVHVILTGSGSDAAPGSEMPYGVARQDRRIGQLFFAKFDQAGVRDVTIGDDFTSGVFKTLGTEVGEGDAGTSANVGKHFEKSLLPATGVGQRDHWVDLLIAKATPGGGRVEGNTNRPGASAGRTKKDPEWGRTELNVQGITDPRVRFRTHRTLIPLALPEELANEWTDYEQRATVSSVELHVSSDAE